MTFIGGLFALAALMVGLVAGVVIWHVLIWAGIALICEWIFGKCDAADRPAPAIPGDS